MSVIAPDRRRSPGSQRSRAFLLARIDRFVQVDMKEEDFIERIRKIAEDFNGDPERQHASKDALFEEFIEFVSSTRGSNDPDLQSKAKLVLSVCDLDFPRWCA